ncbi:MAG TPA: cytochrome-c peroxidase [Bacteroidetes bacterium]|nr:cytochrome-c peroxidase [Bacteroidota bacterium]
MKSFSQLSSLFLACCAIVLLSSCRVDDPVNTDLDITLNNRLDQASNGIGREHYRLPDDGDLAAIPQDPNNQLTAPKVELGKMLFHETALGTRSKVAMGRGTYSCASCHHAAGGFQANRIQGISEGGIGFGIAGEARTINPAYPVDSIDVQQIRTPTALNVAYQELMLWGGQLGATGANQGTESQWTVGTPIETNNLGYHGVETQAIAGLKVHRMAIDSGLLSISQDYAALFDAAFPNQAAAQRISRENAGLAVAAYERTLLPSQAPFQKWIRGEQDALSDQEKQGAILFFGKAQCYSCHNGPALNSMEFYALGMADLQGPGTYQNDPTDAAHKGRGGFTGNTADMFKFKVPQLYNLKDSPFHGHGGNFNSIYDVIRYKNAGFPQASHVPSSQIADEFKPLGLTTNEVRDIAVFIERGLRDPNLYRLIPSAIPSGNCFPNNDIPSRYDLGCN